MKVLMNSNAVLVLQDKRVSSRLRTQECDACDSGLGNLVEGMNTSRTGRRTSMTTYRVGRRGAARGTPACY